MKTRRNVYLIVGIILIILNLLVEITEYIDNPEYFSFNIGYLIGYNFLLICGLVLLRFAYKLQKKINRLKQYEFEESIKNIGNTQSSGEIN